MGVAYSGLLTGLSAGRLVKQVVDERPPVPSRLSTA
jgi:hypothetical protein